MLRNITTSLLLLATALTIHGAAIDDVRKLYREGDYAAAAEQARKIVKSRPKDGSANFYLGASLLRLGESEEAMGPLRQAESRGVGEASEILAGLALDKYDVDAAETHLDTWEKSVKKARKELPESHSDMTTRLVTLRNMLERVEKIEVVDSIAVDSATFFTAYRLSRQAGRILPPDAVSRIGAGEGATELSTAYMPENNSEILWSAADEEGRFALYGADILDDGTLDHTRQLDNTLADGGNAAYPFLMPDGVTLYYAADGDNSLGGYDIFMTRRSDDGSYFQPQNVGMPYNSPFDDYLLAIDETSGLGWWATDRNRIPGKVTVYIFLPSQMRVNVEPDNPALQALAMMSDISLTQREGTDYASLLESKLPRSDNSSSSRDKGTSRFAVDMGDGRVYTSLSDFSDDRARSAMLEYLAAEAALRKHIAEEDAMREKYRNGDTSVSGAILSSEKETASMRTRLKALLNAAVRLETK